MSKDHKSYLTIGEVIESAIDFEKESADYYAQMKKTIDKAEVLELLTNLQEQELSHMQALSRISLPSEGPYIRPLPPFSVPAENPGEKTTFDEMLEIAIRREKNSVEIYEAAATATTGELQRLLVDLQKFEEIHLRQLTQMKYR